MSPDKKNKLNKLRLKLDKVDDQLLKLFKNRTELVKKVLALKKYKKQIVDKKRIKIILKRIKEKSLESKIDTKVTNYIWTNIIKAYIDYERRNFKK
tara:strand:+ start:9 stop:296 length:288 start_codon:yes stop_codon:yes gene_type:complete